MKRLLLLGPLLLIVPFLAGGEPDWSRATPPHNVNKPESGAVAANGEVVPIHLVKDRNIAIDYEVSKLGPSGLDGVELFLTPDHGQSWKIQPLKQKANDDDAEPAACLMTELPGEGVFGLRTVARNGAGRSQQPPQPGDQPEMVIEVDATPPFIQLFNPQPDSAATDTLLLTWTAQDRNLANYPITIRWSADGRDWRDVTRDLPNTGKYSWKLHHGIPARIHLQIGAFDKAGNRSVAQTKEPVLIDLVEPVVRIKGIRGSTEEPGKTYIVPAKFEFVPSREMPPPPPPAPPPPSTDGSADVGSASIRPRTSKLNSSSPETKVALIRFPSVAEGIFNGCPRSCPGDQVSIACFPARPSFRPACGKPPARAIMKEDLFSNTPCFQALLGDDTMSSVPVKQTPATSQAESIEEQCRRLEAIWMAEVGHLSSYTAIVNHPAFREIILLGEAVVPLMLRDLAVRPQLWVWALPEITGDDPVSPDDAGKIARMSEAWLQWGREHGYQC